MDEQEIREVCEEIVEISKKSRTYKEWAILNNMLHSLTFAYPRYKKVINEYKREHRKYEPM